jgi:RimJ/RimL family protein N-acetyltransferase
VIAIPEILTPRLRLRGHRAEDHASAVGLWQDPAIYRVIGGEPLSEQEVWLRLLRYSGLWDLLGFGYWAVIERDTDAYVGQLGFADFRRGLVGFDGHYPEAGWMIHPDHAGKGYATEGMAAACRWLDAQDAWSRSFCIIDAGNLPSRRVAEKLGFRFVLETPFGEATTGVYFRNRGADLAQR